MTFSIGWIELTELAAAPSGRQWRPDGAATGHDDDVDERRVSLNRLLARYKSRLATCNLSALPFECAQAQSLVVPPSERQKDRVGPASKLAAQSVRELASCCFLFGSVSLLWLCFSFWRCCDETADRGHLCTARWSRAHLLRRSLQSGRGGALERSDHHHRRRQIESS